MEFNDFTDFDEIATETIRIDNTIRTPVPWVDKYRPTKINSIMHQPEVIDFLNSIIKTKMMPNLIFFGPPGTGKTSAILALCYELFGPNLINDRVLELNASDERGIDIVRDKIIRFAKTSLGREDPEYPSPPFKIIILDEADSITTDAQSALRKIIETSANLTRFCFTCNYIEKIIQPILSRCVQFRFKPIKLEVLTHRLGQIADKENLNVNSDFLLEISRISEGDSRRAIMMLQNLKFIITIAHNKTNKNKSINITIDDLDKLVGSTPETELLNIWNVCININTTITELVELNKLIKKKCINTQDLLIYLQHKILNYNISDSRKSNIISEILTIECNILDKCDLDIQILYLLSFICLELKKK